MSKILKLLLRLATPLDSLDPLFSSQVLKLLSMPLLDGTGDAEYACQANPNKKLNDFHLRGTSLGGWLVIEPWITPSLFYQFLGASKKWGDLAKDHIGLDSLTFCTALGKEEANRQLRNHWKSWVTEDQIRQLKRDGVQTLRIPVADWMYVPYEPFIGCWDGALEELDRVLALCATYGITVLIDLHAIRRSQNGLDNSGDTSHYRWIGNYSTSGAAIYEHWTMRGGDWVGVFNNNWGLYESIDQQHIIDTLHVVDIIIETYKDNAAVIGFEPVNEPWDKIPMEILKEFYWRTYQLVQLKAPHWITLLADSFRLSPSNFGSFMANCDNYAIDSHIYQAWSWPNPIQWFQQHACADGDNLILMESLGVPIIVGEWSLATDNCAMWLNGLNDNVPGYPKVACSHTKCPEPYMGRDVQPGAPPDPSLGYQDPYGSGGNSSVEYGMCPIDRILEHDEVEEVRKLSYAKLYAFDMATHGQFFWNFRTELETRWDYQQAVRLGWIPTSWSDEKVQLEISTACDSVLSSPEPYPKNYQNKHTSEIVDFPVNIEDSVDVKTRSIALLICLLLMISLFLFRRWRHEGEGRGYGYSIIEDKDVELPLTIKI